MKWAALMCWWPINTSVKNTFLRVFFVALVFFSFFFFKCRTESAENVLFRRGTEITLLLFASQWQRDRLQPSSSTWLSLWPLCRCTRCFAFLFALNNYNEIQRFFWMKSRGTHLNGHTVHLTAADDCTATKQKKNCQEICWRRVCRCANMCCKQFIFLQIPRWWYNMHRIMTGASIYVLLAASLSFTHGGYKEKSGGCFYCRTSLS